MKFLTLLLTKKGERASEKEKEREREIDREREREREKQKHNPTSKAFLELLKNVH